MGSTFSRFMIGQDNTSRDPKTPNKYFKDLKDGEIPAFKNQDELIAAMSRPEYESDPEYREAVLLQLANGFEEGQPANHNAAAAAQRRTDWREQESRQILREHIEGLMKDERYSTSALWRKQVREQIDAHPELFETAMPTPTRISGRVQMDGDDFNAVRAGLAKEKQDKREAEAKAAADRAAKLAAMESYDITKPFGMDDAE